MDKKQLDNSIAGPSLDRLVATKIMGNTVVEDAVFGLLEMHTNQDGINVYYPLRAYSKNIRCATLVISKMVKLAYHSEAAYWLVEDRPDVICKAALRAVFERRKKETAIKVRAQLKIVK